MIDTYKNDLVKSRRLPPVLKRPDIILAERTLDFGDSSERKQLAPSAARLFLEDITLPRTTGASTTQLPISTLNAPN